MKKIITIVYLFLFILITNYSNSEITPPFKNMSISKHPIEYKQILFKDYDGNTINLKDQKGKIYMLNFWATWCLPCKKEMPYLDNLQKQTLREQKVLVETNSGIGKTENNFR